MKTRKFISTMMVCLVLLLVFAVGLVACDPNNNTPQTSADTYYLSLKSTGFETYANAEEIPAGVLLENKDGKYSVSIALKKDEEFTVNKLGGNEKLGYSAIFSSAHQLAEGSDGNIKVTVDGAYDITLAEGAIAYSFTPYVASVQIAAPASVLELGQEYQFAATVKMTDDSETDGVSWSTSNAQVASVSESGLVTALAVGNATIKATSTADTSKFAEYAVQVIQGKVDVQSVTVSPDEVLLDEGETAKLTEQILPDNATDKLVIWESDNLDVATVDGGTVTALSPGIAHITVRTRDGGKEATATVTVRQPVLFMDTFSDVQVVLNGAPRIIRPLLFPTEATNKKIRAYATGVDTYSGNIEVETIEDDTAVSIKGIKYGTVHLTIESVDDPEVTYDIRVQVREAGTKLAWLSENKFNVGKDGTHELEVFGDNAEIESVTWSSDNGNATVEGHSENGKFTATVTGVYMGSSQVTAAVKFKDGGQSSQTATAYVAEDFYFIYGTGLDEMGDDWDFETYISDKNRARKDGRLLEQTEAGTFVLERRLTPEMGFQIIFPSVTSDWESAIKYPSEYYDAADSTDRYVANTADQFRVNTSGIYRIYLYLRSTNSVSVSIKLVELDVDSVKLSISESQRSVLKEGERTVIQSTILPAEVEYDIDELKWSASVDAEDAKIDDEYITIPSLGAEVEYYTNSTKSTMTIYVIKAKETFAITITLELRGVKTEITIPILKQEDEIIPVSEIAFEHNEYLINVNNGGAAWATKVKATVNKDATMQGIVYSVSDAGARVNSTTGDFTARTFGAFTVTATALGDASKTATTTVKVYSDSFYLTGKIKGKLDWGDPEVLPQVATSLEGTAFEQFKFNDEGDHVHFSVEVDMEVEDKFQIVYLGMDSNWTNALTSSNFDEDSCTSASIDDKNIKIRQVGRIKITVDISRKAPDGVGPLVVVQMTRKYPKSISLTRAGGESTLKSGDTFTLTAGYTGTVLEGHSQMRIFVEEGYEDYVDIDYNVDRMIAKCTVKKGPESGIIEFHIYATLFIRVASVKISIIADGEDVVAPSEMNFAEEHYYFNVNNGGMAWQQQAVATMNDDATDKRISYSLKGSPQNATIDPETGVVTATKVGTFTVVATASANTSVTAETLVTFYSDTMYLIGEIGDLQTFTTLSPTTTSIAGSGIYENYAFTMVDRTHFYLERTLEKMKLKAGNYDDYEYGFQIAYLGVDTAAVGVIMLSCYDAAGSYQAETYLAPRENSMRVNVTGVYRIEVSLEDSTPKYTVNFKGLNEQEVKVTADDVLFDEGDSVDITIKVLPEWVELEENKFSYEIVDAEGNSLDEYVGLTFDFAAKKLTATVKKVPLTGDISATVRVTYGEIKGELAATIVGTHHLEMKSDDQHHWMQCVDCDYIEGEKTAHTRSSAMMYDNMTHYYLCSSCGMKFDEHEHFTLDAEGYYDGTHTTCDECGFRMYEISNDGTITKYYGSYGKLKIPTEVNGRQVTGLGNKLFYEMRFIQDVKLCDSLTHIDSQAFARTNLVEIDLKANITYGTDVYTSVGNTNSYAVVNIEEGVTTIPKQMFVYSYIKLDWSTVHGVKIIEESAFETTHFYPTMSLELPDGIQRVEKNAFNGAQLVYGLVIPDSCTYIGEKAFDMSHLLHVSVGKGMTDFTEALDAFKANALIDIVFKAESITYMNSTIFGRTLNTDYWGNYFFAQIEAIYFNMSAEDLMNMPFGNKTSNLPFSSNDHPDDSGGNGPHRIIRHRNAFLYDVLTGQKHLYYYSEVRPAEDVWEFAGAWHYDKDGNVQKWSDTPLDEG